MEGAGERRETEKVRKETGRMERGGERGEKKTEGRERWRK